MILGFIGLDFADRADRKAFGGDDGFGELAGRRERIDFLESRFKKTNSFRAPVVETFGDGKPQLAFSPPRRESLRRQEKIIEGAERAAALDPNVAGSQAVAQRHHGRDLIGATIEGRASSDELSPCRFQKRRRRARRQISLVFRVNVAQHVERGEQRVVGFPGAEHERAEQERNHAAHRRITIDDLTQIVFARPRDDLVGFGDQGFQAFPADRALHGLDLIRSGSLGGQHGFRHAEQRPRRCIERLRSIDDMFLVHLIGAPEHAAEHFVEHRRWRRR